MSIVIGYCNSTYALIMSDSRMSKFNEGGRVAIPYDENYKKFRIMNQTVRIGFAGEALSTSRLVASLPSDAEHNVDSYVNMLLVRKHELDNSILPIHFIIVGLDSDHCMSIASLSSKDDYSVEKLQPKPGQVGYKVALPFSTNDFQAEVTKEIEAIIGSSRTNNDLKNGVASIIKNVARCDATVNAIIRGSEVIL